MAALAGCGIHNALIEIDGPEVPIMDGSSIEFVRGIMSKGVRRQASPTQLLASVCNGAFLLAAAGLLQDKAVTTHWQDMQELARQFPQVNVVTGQRWVDAGDVVSSGGISAGIDMCLYLLSRLHNLGLATATARQMEYHWHSPAGAEA